VRNGLTKEIEALNKQANDNGAGTRVIDYEEARTIEPRLVPKDKFIWSPNTSIGDNKGVVKALQEDCEKNGGVIKENTQFLSYKLEHGVHSI
jgi:L-2-hydroxyglutarate oxidase LhgO